MFLANTRDALSAVIFTHAIKLVEVCLRERSTASDVVYLDTIKRALALFPGRMAS